MKTNLKILGRSLLVTLLSLTLIHCGGGNTNTIHLLVNGQTYELALKNNHCDAGPPSGTGLFNLPVVCSGRFSNTSGLSDAMQVTITDARAVQDALGVFIPISPSLLLMNFTIDGNQLAITSGGAVFSQISNTTGGKTCFEFQVDSAQAHIEGNFCGTTSIGF